MIATGKHHDIVTSAPAPKAVRLRVRTMTLHSATCGSHLSIMMSDISVEP
jgi:hypothetical protein